jgi:hypothetical protein
MRQRHGGWWIFLGTTLMVAVGSSLTAQPSPAAGPEQAYIDYLKVVHGGGDIEAYLGAEGLAMWKPLPAPARRMAMSALVMPGLFEPPRTVKVDANGDRVVLHVATSVDMQRAVTGSPGQPVPVTGRVEMVRHGAGWAIVSEKWLSSDGKPYWSGLVAPGVVPKEMIGRPVDWATGDIRTVISAEAAYSSMNNGYYGTLACLATPGRCLSDYPPNGPTFVVGDLLAATYGFQRRFDEGPRAPAKDVGPGKASRSSIASYAYWIIPEGATTGPSRCGDASGVVCEMPDAAAPSTEGACPQGCTPVR